MINISDSEKLYKSYDHAQKMARGIHFTIDYNGLWYFHNGASAGPIKRKELAALFGGAGSGFMAGKGLFIDDEGLYWLKSPDGQYQVEVEDVPFLVTRMEVSNAGRQDQEINLYTNFDEQIALGSVHPLIVKNEPINDVPVFYVMVRNKLLARFTKAIFYDIINTYAEFDDISSHVGDEEMILRSRGYDFKINCT